MNTIKLDSRWYTRLYNPICVLNLQTRLFNPVHNPESGLRFQIGQSDIHSKKRIHLVFKNYMKVQEKAMEVQEEFAKCVFTTNGFYTCHFFLHPDNFHVQPMRVVKR